MFHRAAVVWVASFLVAACGAATEPGGGSGGTGNGGGNGSGGASGACDPACGESRNCCTDHCVNLQNDPLNCGKCGTRCKDGTYCSGGQCVTVPCQAKCEPGATCCGGYCCLNGALCCDPQGPVENGPSCQPPTNGTCAMGCAPLCICASPDTPIATPAGDRAISSLAVGDLVYSVDHGAMTVARILRTNRTPVSGHHVIRTVLASGAVLEISPGHPTTDGRTFGGLHGGDALDGVEIRSATLVPYRHDATYDILPDTDSGAYFAGGVLIGSTLATDAARVMHATAPVDGMGVVGGHGWNPACYQLGP